MGRRIQMMMTLTVRVVGGDSFTFKNPKSFSLVEDAKGRFVYEVEEDDGISEAKHHFVWENVVCVTEKKHKGEV
jgi:hypothetical protein